MALKATIYKAQLQIADMERHHYQDYNLTIARHPSESDERMMLRLLAYALYAEEDLEFTKGLCADDEPDLWRKSLTDEILLWLQLGQPDDKQIRKACHKAEQVVLMTYDSNSADVWWPKIKNKLTGLDNLTVLHIATEQSKALAELAQRTMQLQFTIQDGMVLVADGERSVELTPELRTG